VAADELIGQCCGREGVTISFFCLFCYVAQVFLISIAVFRCLPSHSLVAFPTMIFSFALSTCCDIKNVTRETESALPSLSLFRTEPTRSINWNRNLSQPFTSPISSCPPLTWLSWAAVEGLTRPTYPRTSRPFSPLTKGRTSVPTRSDRTQILE
jgi:hypothetical protein